MDKAWELWKNGDYPGHHLWGVTHLYQHGIDVDILPHEKYIILNKIGNSLGLGNYLDQQLRILFQSYKYDLIYSACQDNTFLLSFFRYLGIFRKPIICVVHRPINSQSKREKIFVNGHDKLLCLSRNLMNQLKEEFNLDENKIEHLEWVPDLTFYDKKKSNTNNEQKFIIAAGKTERDYNTLVKAFTKINYPLHIYCTEKSAPTIFDITSNIKISYNHSTQVDRNLSFRELVAEYERAYAVAIPLDMPKEKPDTMNLKGLTSLLEAMAIGKAVVMTRNNQIDIDIEKEKIGIWINPGDVEGWQQAISYLLSQPDETREMGNRGYHLCKSKYNLEAFSSNLAKVLKS